MRIFEAFGYLEFVQQSAAVERFNRKRGKPPYAERKLLQWRERILRLFQDQNGTSGQGQLTGEKKPDGASPGNDHITGRRVVMERHSIILEQRSICVKMSHGQKSA